MSRQAVIYLTGAPATGKSTTAAALANEVGAIRLSYGELLTEQLSDKVADQTELRSRSSGVITPSDVERADLVMIERIRTLRETSMVVVDSHALTFESFGFRAVPYSADQLRSIGYTWIICLYASPSVLRARIVANPGGRPLPSDEDLMRHEQLQASLALAYAHTLGIPVAFIDSGVELKTVTGRILQLVEGTRD